MEFVFLLNGLLAMTISVLFISNVAKKIKDPEQKKLKNSFLILGLIYFISAIFSLLWFTKILEFSSADFPFLYSIILVLQTIVFVDLVYKIKKNRKIFLILLFYLGSASTIFLPLNFSSFLLITSFLITLLIFLLIISIPQLEKVANLGIIYSSLSIIFQILVLLKIEISFIFSFFSNLAFLVLAFFIIKSFEQSPQVFFSVQEKQKENSFIVDFLKYFVFIIVLTNFIFIGTISIHEVGHLAAGKTLGCDFGKIVYEEGGLPRTEVLCGDKNFSSQKFVILGGIFLPIILSLLLIFAGGSFIKETALLMIGFNFIISYLDLIDLGFSKNIPIFLSVIGGGLVVFGVLLLARSRTTENEFISLS